MIWGYDTPSGIGNYMIIPDLEYNENPFYYEKPFPIMWSVMKEQRYHLVTTFDVVSEESGVKE